MLQVFPSEKVLFVQSNLTEEKADPRSRLRKEVKSREAHPHLHRLLGQVEGQKGKWNMTR